MSGCCEVQSFDGASAAYKRVLLAVIIINAVMFAVEISAGFSAGSMALKADALDFAADSATYGISLFVIGMSAATRARASLFKAGSLAVIAFVILSATLARVLSGAPPEAMTMGIVAFLALGANALSVLLLLKWRDGDSNVRSVWLCSRNDAIGNVAVIIAAALVARTNSHLPDLVVAFLLCALFLRSSALILSQALAELRAEPAIAGDAASISVTHKEDGCCGSPRKRPRAQ